ncbi:unnamed protein product [Prorocentrum cordatum]|uniref:Uncharacterized protein n=1 Tax=Prorocentrum cordatum TaxID=2364126 RepID=A0ABN9TS97_9DINO|nr:unnamed protein product [Polarella glacialis]
MDTFQEHGALPLDLPCTAMHTSPTLGQQGRGTEEGARGERIGEDTREQTYQKKQTYPASGPHQLLTGGPRARENSSRSRRLRGQRCASPRPPGTRRRAAAAGGCSLRWPLARASVGKPKRYRQR